MSLVALSIAALLATPLLAAVLLRRPALAAGLDGFVLVAVGGIVALHVVPHSARLAGPMAIAFAAAGLFFPIALHRVDAAALAGGPARRARDVVLFLVFLTGIVVHALFDGAALAPSSAHASTVVDALALGVILHRLPVGIALWVVARPKLGVTRTLIIVATYAGGTIAGALLGPGLLAHASAPALAIFQAFVAGSILHIVAESPALPRPRTRPAPFVLRDAQLRTTRPTTTARVAGLVGSALAVAALWTMERTHDVGDAAADGGLERAHAAPAFLEAFLGLAFTIAPAALLSFLVVGALLVVYPERAPLLTGPMAADAPSRGAQSLAHAVRGTLAGLPHPLCSCAVAPLYVELVDEGVPAPSARAFLAAAPSLGVPAIFLSACLLGLPFTAARVAGAAVVAIAAGLSALSSHIPWSRLGSSSADPRASCAPLSQRLAHGLRHGVVDAVDHVGPWLFLGVAVAAAIEVTLDAGALSSISSTTQIGITILAMLPLYVCAAGAVPVAFVLVGKGASIGAVLALLLVGPTTSLPTLDLVRRRHGTGAAIALAVAVVTAAALVALASNTLAAPLALAAGIYGSTDGSPPSLLEMASVVVMALLLGASFVRQGVRGFLVQIMSPQHAHAGDDAHGAHCAHDHGPAVVVKALARVTLPFDPKGRP